MSGLQVVAATLMTGTAAYAMAPPETIQSTSEIHAEKKATKQELKVDILQQTDTPKSEEPGKTAVTAPESPQQPLDNETVIWNYLISKGFTREQTAGIMGNLKQEHNFNTSDAPGGLGIAQWTSGRRANLMARQDYLNVNIQLEYLWEELNSTESATKDLILSGGLENAVIVFQNKFERCNPQYCMESQRIQYAYDILSRH